MEHMRSSCCRNDKMHEVTYNSVIQDFRKDENFNQDLLSAHPRMHACNATLTEQGSVVTGYGGLQEIYKCRVSRAENHIIFALFCLEEVSLMSQHKYLFVYLSLRKTRCTRLKLFDATGN